MPNRNPYIPSERVRDAKEGTTIDEEESREEFNEESADLKRKSKQHEGPHDEKTGQSEEE